MPRAMEKLSWQWNGETARWEMTLTRQKHYVEKGLWFQRSKSFATTLEISVAGSADGGGAGLRACASGYAAQEKVLEKQIKSYLVGRTVRVYGGSFPNEKALAATANKVLREPSDWDWLGPDGETHPEETVVSIDSISIPESMQPTRVYVGVETCHPDPYFAYTVVFEGCRFEERMIVDAYGDVR